MAGTIWAGVLAGTGAAPGGVVIGGGEDKRRITNGPALKKETWAGIWRVGSVITGPGGPC